jgi:hypothetical protein
VAAGVQLNAAEVGGDGGRRSICDHDHERTEGTAVDAAHAWVCPLRPGMVAVSREQACCGVFGELWTGGQWSAALHFSWARPWRCPGLALEQAVRCPSVLYERELHHGSYDTQDGLYDVAWSEIHENQLVTASGDGSIKMWDIMINVSFVRLHATLSVQHSWGRKQL